MYETMYNGALENNEPEIISTGISFIKDDYQMSSNISDSIRRKGQLHSLEKEPNILYWQSPSCGNKLFRQDFIKNQQFLENCMWEDVAFSYSAIIKANSILEFANNDYFYRRDITRGVSSKGYQINPHITDIFKVADEIEKIAKENNRYQLFEEQIKLIQIAICLQRIDEIAYWDIDKKTKNKLTNKMYHLMVEKYGNPQNIDEALLSAKANLNKINDLYYTPMSDEEFFKTINSHK